MTTINGRPSAMLVRDDEDAGDALQVREVQASVMDITARAEIDTQIATAKRYPRSIKRFHAAAIEMATLSEDVAASCFYSLPRGGKAIEGPSARLAEIVASAWTNLHAETRIVHEDDRFITARAVVWDVESNVRIAFEVRRRITDKKGNTYNDDMIGVTANAASSIAFRNAVFKVVPSAFTQDIYRAAREVAIGNAETLGARRAKMMDYFAKMGVQADRVCALLEIAGVEDIKLDHLAKLRGLATAIKDGDTTVDDAFPDPANKKPGGSASEDAGSEAQKQLQAARESLAREKRSVAAQAEPIAGEVARQIETALNTAAPAENVDPLARARSIAAKYTVALQQDDSAGGFVGWTKELPGKMASGATREKAEASVREAAALVIVDAIDHGKPYPQPGEFPPSPKAEATKTVAAGSSVPPRPKFNKPN